MELQSALYLFPVGISNAKPADVLPAGNISLMLDIKYFIVENIRSARRFLKRCDPSVDISAITFYELNRHTDTKTVSSFLDPLRKGAPMGIMSEAGCPAIADPGALAVDIANKEGFRVIPLVGPSSILMALMASGYNGQGFSFNGYLPVKPEEREKAIKDLERMSAKKNITQIFIETPYRNNKMMESLLKTLHDDTMLCAACDVTDPENEEIRSMKISKWKHSDYNFDKRPVVFVIYCGQTKI